MKNKFSKKFDYYGFDVNFYINPFENLEEFDLIKLKSAINFIGNKNKLNYGVFNSESQDSVLKSCALLLAFFDGEPVGFFVMPFFNFEGKLLCNQGFAYLSKNGKIDFINTLGSKLIEFIFDTFGEFYFFSITKIPLLVESTFQNFSNVWPNPKEMRFCKNPLYNKIFDFIEANYPILFKEPTETFEFKKNKFILKVIDSNPLYTNKNIKQLPRAESLEYNLFPEFWLEDTQNEMIIFVGYYNETNKIKNNERISQLETILKNK